MKKLMNNLLENIWFWFLILALFILLSTNSIFGQGNGQPCSNSCTTCSGVLQCDVMLCKCFNPHSVPIELVKFEGYNKDNYNQLEWITATETDNDYFDIERSLDGFNWLKIGRIIGFGTTNTSHNYSFIDYSNDSISYYRLKQVDYNGQYKYSNIISIYSESYKPIRIVNILGEEVDKDYTGLKFYIYKDKVIKRF